MTRLFLVMVLLAACGDDGATADAGGGGACGFDDAYLPTQVGSSWSWRVVDLGTGAQSTKNQVIESLDDDPELGEVLVQRTSNTKGATVSYFRNDPVVVVRLRQEDFDELGALQRTTDYDPGQIRLDQSEARVTANATWNESYAEIEYDAAGVEVSRSDRTEAWEVLGTDVECSSPLGTFSCLHVRRNRTLGGIADKQYFFARGVGKVREVGGNQVEELVDCQAP